VPVAVQILIALIVPGIVFMFSNLVRLRERMRVLDIVHAAALAGNPLSPEMLKSLPGGGHMFPTPQRDFRLGVLLIACGAAIATIGLCVFIAVTSEGGPSSGRRRLDRRGRRDPRLHRGSPGHPQRQ
jgi:hypothetical protein